MTKRTHHAGKPVLTADYSALLGTVSNLLNQARRQSARTVNAILTATYWEIGRRIVEFEQGGKERAGYGEVLIAQLAADLTKRFGRGFGAVNLTQMRKFYRSWPQNRIIQTLSERSDPSQTVLTAAINTGNKRIEALGIAGLAPPTCETDGGVPSSLPCLGIGFPILIPWRTST